MATREKKLSLNKKPIPNSTAPKELVSPEKPTTAVENVPKTTANKNTTVKGATLAKKLTKKTPPKRIVKKNPIGIKLKAKAKKPIKINQKLAKSILQNAKLETKKKLIKNGVKEIKPRKRKTVVPKVEKETLAVLEPIFPAEENVDKKQPKKRITKKALKLELESKKIKTEIDNSLLNADDVTDVLTETTKQKKPRLLKKTKIENETIDDVMSDLSFLIKSEDIKTETDSMSESSKSDSVRSKKITKKQRIELLKKKIIKKENIENTLNKLDSSDQKIIDMLDLNVRKVKKKSPLQKRRHSIEKFPISSIDSSDQPSIHQFTVFSNLPRSISPRSKRNTRVRQSVEGIRSRRSSPYTTRSDSPARILRNGKQRKLKDMGLLDGLENELRKRKRLCSDLSGSEISVSKLSGYESDSSFSDLASLHGAEITDTKDVDTAVKTVICQETNEINTEIDDAEKNNTTSATIKKSPSCETGPTESTNENIIDTNSNVCHINPVDINLNDKEQDVISETSMKIETDLLENNVNPSLKVPEKSIILDIMKQAFNEVTDDYEKNKKKANNTEIIKPSTFYGKLYENTSTQKEEVADVPLESEELQLENTENLVTTENIITESKLTQKNTEFSLEDEKQLNENISISFHDIKPVRNIPNENALPKNDNCVKENLFTDDENKIFVTENDVVDQIKITDGIIGFDNNIASVVDKIVNIEENNIVVDKNSTIDVKNCTLELEENNFANENGTDIGIKEEIEKYNITENDIQMAELDIIPGPAVNPCISTNYNDMPPMLENLLNVEQSAEELALKENILQALGLQSLKAAEEAKQKSKEKVAPRTDSYTGTLKTVIKINRDKKKGRNSLKMTLQKNKGKIGDSEIGTDEGYKIMKDGCSTSWKHGNNSSDTAGAHRKSHYSNRSNMDGSSEHTSDGEVGSQDGAAKLLVIPEKASSFSIHPGRLCKDECSYCFGKFGLFDTPCHIAQLKSAERQNKILSTEKHLTTDSCLCDACYRHVDRKSNTPSYSNKSLKRNSLVAPGPRQNHCHVLGCSRVSTNILRRKWIIKMRKSICQVINIDLDNPGLHSIPICDEHYSALEHLMVCAMCKRRLARNHIHYLGPETNELNIALNSEGIPLTLTDKPVVCKLCKCFATVILKEPDDRLESTNHFFLEYKKRLLHFNDIVPMDEAAAEEPIIVPSKEKSDKEQLRKKKKPNKNVSNSEIVVTNAANSDCQESEKVDQNHVPFPEINNQSRPESPADYSVDYNTLIPAIAMDCGSDTEIQKEPLSKNPGLRKKLPRLESVKEAVEVSKNIKLKNDKHSNVAVQKLGSNPSISVRQLFPGEEDLPLQASIEFANVKEKTPEGWEKCSSVIQYDMETKRLWSELQKPYGSQSSFLRHLILLEKYFRKGDLVLSPSASHHSQNYSESVQNRLRAYDNIPTTVTNSQPQLTKAQKSNSGIITSAHFYKEPAVVVTPTLKNTPITISQLTSPPLIPASAALQSSLKSKSIGAPPGLISLHPGTNRPIVTSLVRVPQSQKIKFPITKNWRPNLIPIDPSKKQERKTGLVQVISGGKPYHITLEDYKKMCAIKRSFEMKKKRLHDPSPKPIIVSHNSVLKSIIPRKGLIISKTAMITSPPKVEPFSEMNNTESILEKLDKQVEKLDLKVSEKSLVLPKIPKSLTVIPQTVARKPSRPSSPVLLITQKSSSNKS